MVLRGLVNGGIFGSPIGSVVVVSSRVMNPSGSSGLMILLLTNYTIDVDGLKQWNQVKGRDTYGH